MDYIFRSWSRRRCLRGGSTTGRTPRRSTCQVTGRKQGGRQPCFCPLIRCGVIGLEKKWFEMGKKTFVKPILKKLRVGAVSREAALLFMDPRTEAQPDLTRSSFKIHKLQMQESQWAPGFHITSSLIHKA